MAAVAVCGAIVGLRFWFVRLKFFTLAHEAKTVEYNQHRTANMKDCGNNRVNKFCSTQHQSPNHKADAYQKILVDYLAGFTRKMQQKRQPSKVIIHKSNGGAVDGNFAPSGPPLQYQGLPLPAPGRR